MSADDAKYQKAKKRVAAIRDFYTHIVVYVVINLILVAINMLTSPGTLWFIWPLLGWGIAVVLHALSVFGQRGFLDPDWEDRKIAEIMEQE